MLKKILFILLFAFINSCSVQNFQFDYGEQPNGTEVIKLKKSIGVIFPKEMALTYYDYPRVSNRFTPTKKQILMMETEIEKQFLKSEIEWANELTDIEKKKIPDYKDYLNYAKREAKQIKYYDRQYFGFIENNEKKIIIQFLDFRKDPYDLKKSIYKDFIIGSHGWFDSSVRTKIYNIEQNKLTDL